MWNDILINLVLAGLAYVVNAIGIHVGVSPIRAADAKKPLWKRRRTWIWISLTAIFFVQIFTVGWQSYTQGSSAKVLDEMEVDLKSMKGMLVTAVSVMQTKENTPLSSTSASINYKTESNSRQVAIAKALNDTVTNPSPTAVRPLTPSQIGLVSLGAATLISRIQQDFAANIGKQEGIDRAIQNDAEQGYIKQGMTKEDAARAALSMHSGSTWSARVADERKNAALQAITKYQPQIDALIEIGKGDTSSRPGSLTAQLAAISNSCSPAVLNPTVGVDECVSTLSQIVSLSK